MNSPRSAAGPLFRQAAFTLVELLVTMVVALLLIVFLFQLFNATMRAWQRGETQNETYREARAAMQMIVRDLSQTTAPMAAGAYPSPTPTVSPAPSVTPVPSPVYLAPVLVLDRYPDPDPPLQSGDDINEEVYCLTNVPNNGVSNLCAVGYFCAWMPNLATDAAQQARTPHAYALMRQFLGSGSATGASAPTGLFERFKAVSPVAGSTPSPLDFLDVYKRARPPSADPAAQPPLATATQVASYIWDLEIRTPTTASAPSPAPTPFYGAKPMGAPPAQTYANVLPPYLEVRFKALSEDAARQLQGNASIERPAWNDANADPSATTPAASIYRKIIQPGTRQFSARVPIYSGSATSTPSP